MKALITQGGYTIGTGSGIIPNGLIAAGQAFFVKALSNSSVTFTNSMRRSGTGKFFKNGETMVEYPGVRLSVVTPLTGYNEVFVTYRSDATDAYDRLFDGEKLENSSSHIALYTFAANKKFAVNAFAPYGDSSIVALGVKTIDAGNHTFSLKELTAFDNEIEIYLRDKTTGTLTNLRTNSTYTVNLNAGEHNSRFELVIKNPEIETTEWKGMKSGSWSNASNWDNGVPTRYKNAKVTSGSVVVNSDMQFNDLIISGEAAVTINQNTQLNARGKVILEANGDKTGTLVDYDGSKEIKAVVKKGILANDRYYYLSSPLTNALTGVYGSTEELSGTNGMERKVYYWDGAWKRINNDGLQLTPMRGYIVKPTDMPNSLIEFDGILNTGLIEYELSKKGFQLIGNPYPSAIDWGFEATPTGWNDTDSLMATIWYRVGGTGGASGGGNFATYNRLSGFSTNGGTRYIPAMQAFWVKVVKPTVISVNNETRTAESTNFFKSSGTSIGFKLTASMNGLNDEAIVFSHINAKDIADDYDSEKYFVDGSASPQLYTTTVDDKLMAVNGFTQFAENQIITLGLRTAVNGTITLQLENLNGFENNTLRVLLVDRVMNNDTIDLSHLKSYTFESSAGDISDRFEIILGVKSTTSITPDEISGINIWGGYRIIGVSSENEQINRIDITDVSGRIVAQKLETTSSETLLTIDLPGVYLVRVYSNKGSMLRKIHVK